MVSGLTQEENEVMAKKYTYNLGCALFDGYKPCKPYKLCQGCRDEKPLGTRILVVNLDALGDVLKTTTLLAAIKRKYKNSHITWLTGPSAEPLLLNNPYIDRIYTFKLEFILPLLCETFDVLLNADKTKHASALSGMIQAKKKFGFGLYQTGAIVPFNKETAALYNAGLDDEIKFAKNTKSNQQLLAEAWALDYRGDKYVLRLTTEEKRFVEDFKKMNRIDKNTFVIGVNTGSSVTYPYKRLATPLQIALISRIKRLVPQAKIALLGGKEDIERNREIAKKLGKTVINTPCDEGLRRGILYVEACDMVATGDTMALHVAIALKKPVVAWFTISCENEIDLYGRGLKVTSHVDCRPCWKRTCDKKVKCNERLDAKEICEAVLAVYRRYGKQ